MNLGIVPPIVRRIGVVCCVAVMGCHDLISPAPLPEGLQDPSAYDNATGAIQQAMGALVTFRHAAAVASFFPMTDELVYQRPPANLNDAGSLLDRRVDASTQNPGNRDDGVLNNTRLYANVAQAALAKYAASTPAALRAEVLAAQGYAELFLADQYCSGIPLSTVDFEGTFTYDSGRTTLDVYQHAATLFERAIPLAADVDSVKTLATVGLARALLAQAQFDSAARVASAVPTGATYAIRRPSAFLRVNGYLGATTADGNTIYVFSIGDREGLRGLPYVSSYDPRVPVHFATFTEQTAWTSILPAADFTGDSTALVLASGVEARLIEAEAALQTALHTGAQGDVGAWLGDLNALRTTGAYTGTDSLFQVDSVGFDFNTFTTIYDTTFIRVDTLWTAGTGGVTRLGLLSDPGQGLARPAADSARTDLMFKERAFWLFLRGQRQGDMRRLIRQYGRHQDQVYPTGSYIGGGTYGNAVNLITNDNGNPRFHGCINRGA